MDGGGKFAPVEESASYDPQRDEATADTAASVNGQSYSEITIDPMEIEPLAHLDYPAAGIDPGLQDPAAPASVESAVNTIPAEEGFGFQQMPASTLEPTHITTTTSVAEEIPGLPQGAVIANTANPEVLPPSGGIAPDGYFHHFQAPIKTIFESPSVCMWKCVKSSSNSDKSENQ